ncbi:MAG: hypothetical protein EP305_05540 [Bacteroidetes bacterium]|nr:MAG: hypothetical protein EP305_05540 [Bacteroidota bacterium]
MKRIENDKFIITLMKKNFIKLEILAGQEIEADDIHEIHKGYQELVGDKEYVVAVYGSDFATISREAMDVAAEYHGNSKRKRVAVITNNLAHILMIRFYILWKNPKTPVQLFKSEQKAFQWLQE